MSQPEASKPAAAANRRMAGRTSVGAEVGGDSLATPLIRRALGCLPLQFLFGLDVAVNDLSLRLGPAHEARSTPEEELPVDRRRGIVVFFDDALGLRMRTFRLPTSSSSFFFTDILSSSPAISSSLNFPLSSSICACKLRICS